MKSYPEYEQSGIEWLGEVPAHWSLRKLKYAVTLTKEDAEERHEDFQIALENIESWTGQFIETDSDYRGSGDAFEKGDILFNKLRPYLAKVYHAKRAGTPVGELLVLRPETDMLSRFLFYRLLSAEFIDVVDGSTYGAKMPRASWDFIGDLSIPIPPLPEQRTIAAYLDRKTAQIDTLIAKKQRLIDLLQEQRTAIINRAVTQGLVPDVPMQDSDIEWLGEVPAHWGTGKLRYVTDLIQTGPFGSQLHASDYIENGLPVINPSNLVDGNIEPDWQKTIDDEIADRLSRHRLSKGDIVFARRGEMGRCALVSSDEEEWLCGTGSIKVELQKESVDPKYMSVVLSTVGVSEWLELQSVGSTMSNLNTDILSAIPIPIPPRQEQEEIVEYISKRSWELDQIIDRETKEINFLQELRTSLISEVVTGKIDVRGEVFESAEVAA